MSHAAGLALPARLWSRFQALSRLGVGLLIGGLALWWAGRGLDLPLLGRTLAQVSTAWVLVSLGCVLAVALAKAARWGVLYQAGSRPGFWDLFSVLVAGQLVNLLLPIRLGEVVRIGMMKQRGQPGAATLSTILVEKTLDLLAAGLVATSLVVLAVAPAWLRQPAGGLLLVGLVLAAGLVLLWRQRDELERFLAGRPGRWLPGRAQRQLGRVVQTLFAGLGSLTSWRALAPVLGWTVAVWLLSLLAMLALFRAFELQLPLAAAALLMLAVSTSNIVPSPPALIGLMHGMAVVVLGQYGVDQAGALGFGIVLHLVTVTPLLLLGSWVLWSRTVPVFTWLGGRTSTVEGSQE